MMLQLIWLLWYFMLTCWCIPLVCVGLMIEVNTFFLHGRKLLQHYEVDEHAIVDCNKCYMFCSCIMCVNIAWAMRVIVSFG